MRKFWVRPLEVRLNHDMISNVMRLVQIRLVCSLIVNMAGVVSRYAAQYAQSQPVTARHLQHDIAMDDLGAPWVIRGPNGRHFCTLCQAYHEVGHEMARKHTNNVPWAFELRDWYHHNGTLFRVKDGTAVVAGHNHGLGPVPPVAMANAVPPVPVPPVAMANAVPPVPNQAAAGPPAQVQLSDLTQAFSDAMQQVCNIEQLQTQAASHTELVGLVEALMARVTQLEEQQGNDADADNFQLHQTVNGLEARLAGLEAQGQRATTDVDNDVLHYNLHQ